MADDEEQLPLFDLPDQPATEPDEDAALAAELRRVRDRNASMVEVLRRGGVRPDPITVLAIQLDTLIDLILDPEARLRFDLLRETRMAGFLNRCLADLRQAELLATRRPTGTTNGGRLIVPGQ